MSKPLSATEALDHLATLGITTSRQQLARLRDAGDLPFLETRGRPRYLYRKEDLEAAYLREGRPCLSSTGAGKSGTSAAPSRVSLFERARAAAAEATPRPTPRAGHGRLRSATFTGSGQP